MWVRTLPLPFVWHSSLDGVSHVELNATGIVHITGCNIAAELVHHSDSFTFISIVLQKERVKRKTRWAMHSVHLTVWPSGLRRYVKAVVRKGVGSNPTAVICVSRGSLALVFPCCPASRESEMHQHNAIWIVKMTRERFERPTF